MQRPEGCVQSVETRARLLKPITAAYPPLLPGAASICLVDTRTSLANHRFCISGIATVGCLKMYTGAAAVYHNGTMANLATKLQEHDPYVIA